MTVPETMFSTREVPWMKVGTVIDRNVNASEAAQLGGLNFDIGLRPTGYFRDGVWTEIPNRLTIIREDTGEAFGIPTEKYIPVQYTGKDSAFSFMDAISPRYVGAGSLKGGRQGFLVVELPDTAELNNLKLNGESDPHQIYVILRTSQDMTRGLEVAVTTLRERCMNQLTLPALTHGAQQSWSIRHTRNIREKMSQAQRVLSSADSYGRAFAEIASQLADIDVDWEDAKRTLNVVLPDKPKRAEQIDAITTGWNAETVGFQGTGWGLVNAVDEYFEWTRPERARTVESHFTTSLDGAAHLYTGRVAQLLLNR